MFSGIVGGGWLWAIAVDLVPGNCAGGSKRGLHQARKLWTMGVVVVFGWGS